MKILVAVKQVAALDEDFTIREDGRDVDADFLIRDLNEWDDFSLEEAVKIKEAASEGGAAPAVEVVAVSVGPEEVDESLAQVPGEGRRPRDSRLGPGHRRVRSDCDRAGVGRGREARGARDALCRGAIIRPSVRLHRHRHRRIPRLAARRGRELA